MSGDLHPIALAWRNCWPPPDRRPIYDWAAEHIELPSELTITGKFNPQISRHFLEIFDALADDRVRSVTLMKPVGSGGTLIADIWTCWAIANDPGAFLAVFQDDAAAKDDCEDRLNPMLDHCRPIQALLSGNRHFHRTQEVKFSNGMPLYVRGPSLGNLQARRIRYLHLEETWMWPAGLRQEALGRIKDWEEIKMSKVFDVSQGGSSDDDLDKTFRDGDQREWHVPCLSCGKYAPAIWGGKRADGTRWGIVWDDNERTRDKHGEFLLNEVLPTVRWECPACGHPHLDGERTKTEWTRLGKYLAQNPKAPPDQVSFHFDALIVRNWAKQVRNFIEAVKAFRMGIQEPLVKIVQKDRARSWSEVFEPGERRTETFELSSVPAGGEKCITIDTQSEGVFPAMVCQWEPGKAYRLWSGYLYSEAEIEAKQEEFKIPAVHVLIDSGWGSTTRDVYRMAIRHKWIVTKGSDQESFTHYLPRKGGGKVRVEKCFKSFHGDPELGKKGQGRTYALGIRWSNPTIKSRLRKLIDRGRWLEPNCDPEDPDYKEYQEQMRSERLVVISNKTTGRPRRIWKAFGANHYWDDACQQVLFATIKGLLPDMGPPDDRDGEK